MAVRAGLHGRGLWLAGRPSGGAADGDRQYGGDRRRRRRARPISTAPARRPAALGQDRAYLPGFRRGGMRGSPPLRFLVVVLGGWAAVRTALLAPLWPVPPIERIAAHGLAQALPQRSREVEPGRTKRAVAKGATSGPSASPASSRPPRAPPRSAIVSFPLAPPRPEATIPLTPVAPLLTSNAALAPPSEAGAGRWSLSGWAFVRSGGSAGLAAGGLLGGSQAGARARLSPQPG